MSNQVIDSDKWYKAKPQEIPSPTYWPFFLALGVVFVFWGITTTIFITLIGVIPWA